MEGMKKCGGGCDRWIDPAHTLGGYCEVCEFWLCGDCAGTYSGFGSSGEFLCESHLEREAEFNSGHHDGCDNCKRR